MNTSASATSRRNTACPDGARRSSARLFLLRPSSTNPGLLSRPGPIGGVARRRYGSPAPGGSILITSAPKSDITVAAAGPAIKLAQSITFSPSKTRPGIADPLSNCEAERVAVARDVACGASREVRADDQSRSPGEPSQHRLAGTARLSRVGIRGRGPLRPGHLTGVVHKVAGDQRCLPLRGDPHADVTRGMARGRDEMDLVADPVIGLDQIDEAGIPDRRHRVRKNGGDVVPLVLARPMRVLDPAHQIARIGKGRNPAAVDQHRVPPDMIDMEMGADHRVDRLARIAGSGEISQKARLQFVPGRDAAVFLVVAKTGVDDETAAPRLAPLGLHDKGVDAHLQPTALVGKVELQPADRQYFFISRLRQDEPAAAGDFELDDLGDRDLADAPFHGRWPAYCTCKRSTSKIRVALGGIAPPAPRAP